MKKSIVALALALSLLLPANTASANIFTFLRDADRACKSTSDYVSCMLDIWAFGFDGVIPF